MSSKVKVCIIGAGPAGMTAAYQLSKKKNVKVEVFEASQAVGGLARSIRLWNQTVDIGPHRFFSSDRNVNALWLEVVKSDYRMVERLTRIYYEGKFFHYPLKPLDALTKLGVKEALHCLLSYGVEKLKHHTAKESFEDWVTAKFGRRLFEIFFKTYSEKLWGLPCSELDSDFAAQRIRKLSLSEVLKSAFSLNRGGKHKTMVEQFAYPLGGTGSVYEKMKEVIVKNGGIVHLGIPVRAVKNERDQVAGLELEGGAFCECNHIISTMPITLLVERLHNVPGYIRELNARLKFRNTIMVYLLIDRPELFPDNWLYVHSGDLRVGRITNFRNWVPELYGAEQKTILACEYWCYGEDHVWHWDDETLIGLARKEIGSTGLVRNKDILDGHIVRIPRCYPVYEKGYRETLAPIQSYLMGIRGLFVIGRYGAFKYNNQDHSIFMGMLAAENITEGRSHDLWRINTDYDQYQEGFIITNTGLEKG